MMVRLLCDDMLTGLARWLRAAGHDTAVPEPAQPDGEIMVRCRAEGRVLVTRDRRLAQAAADQVETVLLTSEDLDDQALALVRALGLDWTSAPFTRCLVDNSLLEPADAVDLARIPAQSRAMPGPFRRCPSCRRVFWPGSHVKRMTARLQHWRDLERDEIN